VRHTIYYRNRIIFCFIPLLLLCGCSSGVEENVVEFVKKAKTQKSQYVSKLPKFEQAEPFRYTAAEFHDPFSPFSQAKADTNLALFQGGPDLNRSREPLEAFPLDSLQMVGTIERDGVFFALLKNGVGMVYRVSIGNYIGQNSGKIEKINGNEIQVKEWLSDGKGGWREHLVTIPLLDAVSKTKGA